MRWKIAIKNMVIITAAFVLFVIWYQNYIGDSVQETFSRIKQYDVYLITTDKQYQYWSFINQGAFDMAEAAGIRYKWEAPAERDVNLQIDVINKAVEEGADALLVAADDPKRISGVIEDSKARGVKVIYVDSPAYEDAITTLATDNYAAGVQAGIHLISTLEGMGVTSGSVGIISIAAKANSALREAGFRDTLAQNGRYQVLDTVYAPIGGAEDSQEAAERVIKENSDLVALYGTNEGTSVGVGNAIKANNNKYVGIGFDDTETMLELLREGSIKVIIAQNPYTMGYLGTAQAVAALLGKDTGPDYIDTGVRIITGD